MEAKAYVYTTKEEEMSRVLVARGIQIPNFAYDFSIIEGSNRLSDTTDRNFLLPMHVLKVSFHLPLHPFCHLLDEYNIAPRQLFGFSWWVVMAYFIECSRREEMSLIAFFPKSISAQSVQPRRFGGFVLLFFSWKSGIVIFISQYHDITVIDLNLFHFSIIRGITTFMPRYRDTPF